MRIKIIHTTTDSEITAINIAKILVSTKLSPCVQVISKIKSIYEWSGELEITDEILLIIKTIPENIIDCKELILKHHNYDVPELIVYNGEIIVEDYADWFINN